MKKIVFLIFILLELSAKAESCNLNDYLFHLKVKLNNSKTLGELVTQIPGTLEEKSKFVKDLREKHLADQAVPTAKVIGSQLEINLKPKLIIDFAQLQNLIVIVNGKTLDLKTNKDWMEEFNKAYHPNLSWRFFLETSYAEDLSPTQQAENSKLYPLNTSDQNIVTQTKKLAANAWAKASDAAGIVFLYSLQTYIRCKEGINDCPFFSQSDVIIERLSGDDYLGLKEFQCENGKLKKIQALETEKGEKKLPLYEFFYLSGSDEVKIKVENYEESNGFKKGTCYFIYNKKTHDVKIQPASTIERCGFSGPEGLTKIGLSTPVSQAFLCCHEKSCEEKVLKFKENYLKKSATRSTGVGASENGGRQ